MRWQPELTVRNQGTPNLVCPHPAHEHRDWRWLPYTAVEVTGEEGRGCDEGWSRAALAKRFRKHSANAFRNDKTSRHVVRRSRTLRTFKMASRQGWRSYVCWLEPPGSSRPAKIKSSECAFNYIRHKMQEPSCTHPLAHGYAETNSKRTFWHTRKGIFQAVKVWLRFTSVETHSYALQLTTEQAT